MKPLPAVGAAPVVARVMPSVTPEATAKLANAVLPAVLTSVAARFTAGAAAVPTESVSVVPALEAWVTTKAASTGYAPTGSFITGTNTPALKSW